VSFVVVWIAQPQGWSAATTAFVVLAMRLPALLSGPLGGRAVDRFGPERLLLVDGVARSILMGWLLMAGRDGHYPIAVVLIAGAAAGASVPFGYAAARTLLPRMVDGAIRERRRHRW
jgi:MFS family permease